MLQAIFRLVGLFCLVILNQNCSPVTHLGSQQGANNDSISKNKTNHPNGDVQDLVGTGEVTLEEAIHMQDHNGHHVGHQVHSGDDDKIGDHSALIDLIPKASHPDVNVALRGGSFFNPNNWSLKRVPGNGDRVYIPMGVSMVYDQESEARIDRIGIDGGLHFAVDRNTLLYVDTLLASRKATVTIGTDLNPIQENITAKIIIHRDNGPVSLENDPKLLSKGVILHGTSRIAGQEKEDHYTVKSQALTFASSTF